MSLLIVTLNTFEESVVVPPAPSLCVGKQWMTSLAVLNKGSCYG